MTPSLPDITDVFGFAAGVLLRATALLTGALLLSQLLRRTSAGASHAFWTVTTAALLLLPWLPAALPTLPMPWLQLMSGRVSGRFDEVTTIEVGNAAEALQHGFDGAERVPTSARLGAGVLAAGGAVPGPAAEVVRRDAHVPGFRTGDVRVAGSSLLVLLWAFGAIAATAALGLGLVRVRRLAREAQPIQDAAWRESLARACRRVGVRRPVDLRITAAAPIPLAGGLTHPFVLMPSGADGWSMELRDLVLTHELVHVARHDALRQILSRLASALYWFHPLAHVAARKVLLAREQACDEAVIALGNRPSVYARHLLELADPARVPLPILSLIERPQLEARVMAILRPGHRSGRAVTAAAAVCASLWALTVAASAPTVRADVVEPSAVSGEGPVAAGSERERFSSGERSAAPAAEATTHPASLAALTASSAVLPRLLPQERTCWSDAAGESFVGNTFSYTQLDGSRVTERYGWVGDDRVLQTRTGETMVCMRAHGSVTFSEDGERVAAMAEGSWIVMGSRDAGRSMDLVITSAPSGPEYAWYVDGARRDFGPEAMEWRNAMVPLLAAYWDVAEAGAARQALAASESALRANLEALAQARREAELTRARVADELVARQERRNRELLEAAGVLDSLSADRNRLRRRERTLPEGQVEALRRELEAAVERLGAQVRESRPEADSVRAALGRSRAEMEAVARATRDQRSRTEAEATARATRGEAVGAELARAQAELSRMEAQRRTELDRVAREVEQMSRRGNTADPAALERRLAEIQQQLEQEIRRLQEAIRRIP